MKKIFMLIFLTMVNYSIASEPKKESKSNAKGQLADTQDNFVFDKPFPRAPKNAKPKPSQEYLRFEEVFAICGGKDAEEKAQWEIFANGPLKKYPARMRKTLAQQKALFAVFKMTLQQEREQREVVQPANAQLKPKDSSADGKAAKGSLISGNSKP